VSELQLQISNLGDLAESSKKLLEAFPNSSIFAFRGELGAGKTTFIKALCQQLGVEEVMSSPSFSIINEYRSIGGEVIYHFDLYRLKSIEEALDIGMEEYLYSDNHCFVEWPERAEGILPAETVFVNISVVNGLREISCRSSL